MKGKFLPVIIRRLVELLTTSDCLSCAAEGQMLCFACLERLSHGTVWQVGPAVAPLSGLAVGGYYDGPLKALIWRLKYHQAREAAGIAAQLITQALPEDFIVEMVTSVPIAPARYHERGYNQAGLIGRAVARRLGLPYRSLLGRENATHQVGLSRRDRLRQVQGAFYSVRRVDGARVLIVDDVVTTGATLGACADVLVAAGAEAVWGGAVARH